MKTLQHKFVEFIPSVIIDGIIYISIIYKTAVHNCVCGCGNRVVTPITPTDWQLNFNGKSISLYPSIGNWNFACMSHYFITNNEVHYCRKWSKNEIEQGRKRDKKNKINYNNIKSNRNGNI